MVCSERPTEPYPNVEPSSLRRGLTHISKVLSDVHYSKQGFPRISCANQNPASTAASPMHHRIDLFFAPLSWLLIIVLLAAILREMIL